MKPWLRVVGAFVVAVLATAVLATTASTQSVLAQLGALGVEISLGDRLNTTFGDWLGMGPVYAILIAAGFLVALLVAALLSRWLPRHRAWLYPLAGAAAMTAMLLIMRSVFDITLIAGARTGAGFGLQVIAGAAGAWLFARLTEGTSRHAL